MSLEEPTHCHWCRHAPQYETVFLLNVGCKRTCRQKRGLIAWQPTLPMCTVYELVPHCSTASCKLLMHAKHVPHALVSAGKLPAAQQSLQLGMMLCCQWLCAGLHLEPQHLQGLTAPAAAASSRCPYWATMLGTLRLRCCHPGCCCLSLLSLQAQRMPALSAPALPTEWRGQR